MLMTLPDRLFRMKGRTAFVILMTPKKLTWKSRSASSGVTSSAALEHSVTSDLLPVRLLGVGATRLTRDPAVQRGLFDGALRGKQATLDRAVDAIRGQFGNGAIRRGSLVDRPRAEGADGG